MRILLRTAIVAAAVAATMLVVAPSAHASALYPPSGSCTTAPATIEPGGEITFSCVADTFGADETVTITVSGENGAGARIGFLHTAITTASGTATSASDGSLPEVRITLPGNAAGTYNVAAVSASSAGGTAAVTVTRTGGGLPITGGQSESLVALGIGGGALVLVGAGLGVAAMLRRRAA